MSRLADWFAIFRTGTHTDRHGRTATFAAADLDGLVERFTPGDSNCVITHEELYSPFGYGRINELKRDGDVLYARCDEASLEPQFAELIEAGRLHNRSVQLIPEAGGGHRLGHVAFLGAEPPAVSGLPPIAYATAALVFSTADAWDRVRETADRANLWEALRRVARRLLPESEADELVPEWQANIAREDVGAAREAAEREDRMDGTTTTYSAADIEAARRQGAADAAAEAERTAARATARTELSARVKKLVDEGRLTPAQSHGLVELGLGLDAGLSLEFAAGDGGAVRVSPREHLFRMLEGLPVQIRRGREFAGAGTDPGAPPRDAGALRAAALEYQANERRAGRAVDIVTAVRHVAQGAPA